MSFAMLPTVEMEGPGGRIIVNNCEEDIASMTERGYKVIPGTSKGGIVAVVTDEDLAVEKQAEIDAALEAANIAKNPKAPPIPNKKK